MNIKRIRGLVALLVFVIIGVGLALHTGTGTISSMGYQWIATICPLGALESLLGSWAFVPRLIIALVVVALVCFLVGKAFCSWVCPIPHIQNLFTSKKRAAREARERSEAADRALARYHDAERTRHADDTDAPADSANAPTGNENAPTGSATTSTGDASIPTGDAATSTSDAPIPTGSATVQADGTAPMNDADALVKSADAPSRTRFKLDGRHVVLGGALASAAVFGFPVFCLVCPIGLTVGEFVLFWRFVQYNEATWALLLFPAIVILEVVVFRRWCGTICPMGALLSLFGAANKTLRPTVDKAKCLRDTKGADCKACDAACPERIDPHSDLGDRSMAECVRCGNCKAACPVAAISFPFLKSDARKAEGKPRDLVE